MEYILIIAYAALGYWAAGQTVYANKNLYSQPKMPNGREIFSPGEANFRRHTLCMARKFNEVWRKKIRLSGILSVVNTGSKIRVGKWSDLFFTCLVVGLFLGFVLIPVAVIKRLILKNKNGVIIWQIFACFAIRRLGF